MELGFKLGKKKLVAEDIFSICFHSSSGLFYTEQSESIDFTPMASVLEKI